MRTLTPIVRPPWLPHEQWPFPTSALTTATGQRIAVTDVGTGPTLLFVHVGGWSFVWRDLLLELSQQYRCVTIDPPGSGQSSQPTAHVSLQGAADAVEAVIDALDLRASRWSCTTSAGQSGWRPPPSVPTASPGSCRSTRWAGRPRARGYAGCSP